MKSKTVILIDDGNWDKLVEDTYSRPYTFQQQDGCKMRGTYQFSVPIENPFDFKNDSVPEIVNGEEMGVSFKSWLERDPKQPIKDQRYEFELGLFWERNFYPSVEMIIDDLFKRQLLSEGEYIINIDW